MSKSKVVKAKLLNAEYLAEAQSVVMLLECEQGRFTSQIHRSSISQYGEDIFMHKHGDKNICKMTEEEITKEMNKYVDILKNIYMRPDVFITAIFDPDLKNKKHIQY